MRFQFLLQNGRAVLCPAYKGCFDRKTDLDIPRSLPNPSHEFTQYLVWWVKDFKRSIDYLETRPETFDLDKLAYFGFSWGGWMGNIIPAVEERLSVSLLKLAGLVPLGQNPNMRALPEADPFNYVTRVKIPTLIVGGKYDMSYPYETAVKPMIDLLGTPEADIRVTCPSSIESQSLSALNCSRASLSHQSIRRIPIICLILRLQNTPLGSPKPRTPLPHS